MLTGCDMAGTRRRGRARGGKDARLRFRRHHRRRNRSELGAVGAAEPAQAHSNTHCVRAFAALEHNARPICMTGMPISQRNYLIYIK